MAKRPMKRANWEFRLNDETYRLMIRTLYRTSVVIPRIVSMNQLIGCICYFIKQKTFDELESIFNLESGRPIKGEHLVYANGLQPFADILEETVDLFWEKAQTRTYKNHLLLIMMREYILQRDEEILNALKWSDHVIAGGNLEEI